MHSANLSAVWLLLLVCTALCLNRNVILAATCAFKTYCMSIDECCCLYAEQLPPCLTPLSLWLAALSCLLPAPAEVGSQLTAANLGWPAVFGLLNVTYYLLHYMFASQVRWCTAGCAPRLHAELQGKATVGWALVTLC